MNKILWVDVETTGFSPKRNGIISIAAFMMIDGVIDQVKGRFVAEMNPVGREIEDSALAVNGFTRERIASFKNWDRVLGEFALWLIKNGCRDDEYTRAICAGYVPSFDVGMMNGWFDAVVGPTGMKLSDFVMPQLLDVCEMAKKSLHPSLCLLPNKKLTAVSKALGVDPGDKAHNAEADILATIEVWKKLVEHDGKRSFA